MYKVVIVDDEPIIVQGLSKAIDWSKWNCEVVGSASDGIEGLKLVRHLLPNILISDISMPNLDGLGLIAAIKSEFPNMQVTILTGFRDFEYARSAIELGVTRFLLKPSKYNELEEAIAVMTNKLAEMGISPDDEPILPDGLDISEDEDINSANSFIVNNAMEYIRAHYNEKLKLADVAEEIYVSQWHLSKLLNKYTGQNFSELINGIRIEHAKELLRDPSMKIYDVANEVGFVDLPHFSRVFKKIAGLSANEYRNSVGL
ncbi:MAG: response regulator [Lachnospiraceae bacterium]|nr:response regulator [Lachnospiraceae bacterium]